MAPVSAQLGLLTLVSAALAQPYHGHGGLRHGRYHHRDVSSAAPYGFSNGTEAGPTAGSGTAPGTAYSTTTCTNYVTVQPVASVSASSVNTEYNAASSYAAASSSSTCGGTVYETYTNTVTVTASASSSVASAGTAFYPGTTSSVSAPVASYSASASPFSSYSAPAYSAPAPSSSAAASSSAPAVSSAAPATSSYSAPAYSAPASSSSSAASYSAPAYSSSSSSSSSAPAYTPTPYSSTSTPSSSSTSSSATPSSTSVGTGKRGCIYQSDPTHCDALLSDQLSWANNWVSTPGTGLPSSLTYVPQFHSMDQIWVDSWDAAATSGASVLAAWNEPDQPSSAGGSGLTPGDAYSNWDLMTKYQSGSVRITSPAVSSTVAPNMGLDWLQQFSKLGASWDITNIHFYGDCTNTATAQAFNDWVSSVRSAYPDQPLYVSEYGCYDGASDDQMSAFITSTAQFMDSQDYVERYAFFRADPGYLLNSDGSISSAGTTYKTCT